MSFALKNSLFLAVCTVFVLGCNDLNEPTRETIKPEKIANENNKEFIEKEKNTPAANQEVASAPLDAQKDKTPIVELSSYPKTTLERTSSIVSKETIKNFDFNIIKKGFKNTNTLLIVGGIQGDEPGGFMAASLITTHYEITKGSVWIIPNLNFYSIIKRSRGPYGDMNRKFADLSKNDPEYESIQRIKRYINDESVKLIVNLHDGSGYYRPSYEDAQHSPAKWGQCSIIDQETLQNNSNYANLLDISNNVVSHVNQNLITPEHVYHLHNTRTREGDKEMEKTLTYYAINQGKAAFGNEASKDLPTHQRTYYHLLALEKYMDIMGIEYKRKFNLNDQVVKNIIDNDIEISLYNNKITLPLSKIRDIIKYFPIKHDGTIDFIPSNPLMSIVKKKNEYIIYYGNRRLSRLKPDYMDYSNDNKETSITMTIDSQTKEIALGSLVNVKDTFSIQQIDGYRVNVIGFVNGNKEETDVLIGHKDILEHYSIDKDGSIYRIEFYAKEKFAGMILVKFTG